MRRLIVALALCAACVHQRELVPGPGAPTQPGRPQVAEETVEGVKVQVDPSAWTSAPVRDVLSPVRVTVQNGSGHPLVVSHDQFTLRGPSGFRLAALPPQQVLALDVASRSGTVPPGFVGDNFLNRPWEAGYFRGAAPWYGPFPYDPIYYNRWYGAWPTNVPNEEIIRHALPEGVLEPGGKASGFLYFKDQPPGTPQTMYVSLVDAERGQPFGAIDLPFTVR